MHGRSLCDGSHDGRSATKATHRSQLYNVREITLLRRGSPSPARRPVKQNARATPACALHPIRSALCEKARHGCLSTGFIRRSAIQATVNMRFTELLKLRFNPRLHHRSAWSAAQAPWLRVVRTATCALTRERRALAGSQGAHEWQAGGIWGETATPRGVPNSSVITRARLDRPWAIIPGPLGCAFRAI